MLNTNPKHCRAVARPQGIPGTLPGLCWPWGNQGTHIYTWSLQVEGLQNTIPQECLLLPLSQLLQVWVQTSSQSVLDSWCSLLQPHVKTVHTWFNHRISLVLRERSHDVPRLSCEFSGCVFPKCQLACSVGLCHCGLASLSQ